MTEHPWVRMSTREIAQQLLGPHYSQRRIRPWQDSARIHIAAFGVNMSVQMLRLLLPPVPAKAPRTPLPPLPKGAEPW